MPELDADERTTLRRLAPFATLPGVLIAAGLTAAWIGHVFAAEPTDSSTRARAATTSSVPDKPNPAGVWAQKLAQTAISDVAILGDVETVTTTYMRTRIERKDGELMVSTEVCDARNESNTDIVETHLPQAFVDTLDAPSRPARIVETKEGPRLLFDRQCYVRGAHLRSPEYEHLPTSPDDPRVSDADGDGKPGVTIEVRGFIDGELYLVQRACDQYRGRFVSSDRIEGTIEWESDQEILSSNSIFLGSQPETRPHPDSDESHFTLVRLSPDVSCEGIMERRAELFD